MVRPNRTILQKALTCTLALLLLSALAPPAVGAPEPAKPLPDEGIPEAWREGADLRLEDGTGTAERLQERLDPLQHVQEDGTYDLRGLTTSLRHAAAADGGLLAPIPLSAPSGDVTVASHWSGTVHWGLPAGDLDGDGLDEVLDYAVDIGNYTVTVSGVDGDGTFLWSTSYAADDGYYDAFPMYTTDLDGDGANEVVMLSLQLSGVGVGQCVILTCAGIASASGTWNIEVLDGATGAVDWAHTEPLAYEITYGFASGLVAFGYVCAVTGMGLGLYIDLSEDVDGDGAPDLLVDRFDATFFVAVGAAPFVLGLVYGETYTTDYTLLGGPDGATISTGRLGPTTGLPVALSAGDIDGDGLADLVSVEPMTGNYAVACVLYCAGTTAGTHTTLRGLRGTDGETLWTNTAPQIADHRILIAVEDLTGDGVRDILFGVFTVFQPTYIETYDGKTGVSAYTADIEGFYYVPVGDVDGDGGSDLLAGRWGDTAVRALSGATGSLLWETNLDSSLERVWFTDIYDAGDVDADGRTDLLAVVFGRIGHEYQIETTVLDADGTTLWTQTTRSYTIPAGNLDGSSGTDFAALSVSSGDGGVIWNITGLAGETGSHLWSTEETLIPWSDATIEPSGDLDGDGTADIIHSALTESFDAEISGRVRGLSGSDGTTLFTYGAELQVPIPLDQDDAGSGRDAGSDRATAVPIDASNYTGMLEPSKYDVNDGYLVNATANETLYVWMAPDGVDYDLFLYDPDDHTVGASWNWGSEEEEIEIVAQKTGAYRVRVAAWEPADANYTFGVSIGAAPEPEPEPEPEPVDPRAETFVFKGHIGCAASAGLFQTNDRCSDIDANSKDTFGVFMDRGVSGVHVEARWTTDTLGAERLQVSWTSPSGLGGAEGTSPLVYDQSVDPETPWTDGAVNATLHVRVGKDQGVVVGQPFEVCTTVLYGGADLPEGSCFDA